MMFLCFHCKKCCHISALGYETKAGSREGTVGGGILTVRSAHFVHVLVTVCVCVCV